MPSADQGPFPSCEVCGRSILRGERISEYVTPDGERVSVCSLCKPSAEASEWTPVALAGRIGHHGSARRRRTINLRERLAKVSAAAGGMLARGEEADAPAPRRSAPRPSPQAPQRRAHTEPPSPERAMRRAIEAFNRSPEARTVRGLLRSLGAPRVAVRAGDGAGGRGPVTVTVAWELSWYQWEVAEGGDVREVGKGKEVSELADADRGWNARAGEDGRLALTAAGEPERANP